MWVYKIQNTHTNKMYIGQTIKENVSHRWREHTYALNKNKHHNKDFQNEWNIYGKASFVFQIIQKCKTISELDKKEAQLILEYKASNKLYNVSEGGQVSRVVYCKKWNGLKSPDGKIYSNIKNISEFARKHGLNDDKLRQVSRGDRYSYKGWVTLVRNKKDGYRTPVGKKMSKESSKKKSISLKTAYREGRKVAGVKLRKTYNGLISPDGLIHNNVVGLANFCRQHGLPSVGSMSEVCSGKRKHYKGWTYNPPVTLEK